MLRPLCSSRQYRLAHRNCKETAPNAALFSSLVQPSRLYAVVNAHHLFFTASIRDTSMFKFNLVNAREKLRDFEFTCKKQSSDVPAKLAEEVLDV